jgi:signal transduction histidine kinase
LSSEQAHDAILNPVKRLGIRYEQNLIETIVGDLGRENVEPLQLQIVCEQLYENRSGKTMSLADYERMGRAEGILAAHLKLDLAKFGRDRPLAENVLAELITAGGTKQMLTQAELVTRLGEAAKLGKEAKVDEERLDQVLKRLVDYRLVRRHKDAGEGQYELAHEYLINEIKTWISDEELRLKAVKELLERELSNWRIFHTLINPDRLRIIEKWVELGQLPLTQEEQELIDESRKQRTLDEQEQLQLIQFAKMTSLDQLVLGIDHELSSPVASIRSNSQFLQEDVAELKSILERLPDLAVELSRGEADQLALEQDKKERADDTLETRFYRYLEGLGQQIETWIKDGELWTVLDEIDQISDEVRQAVAKMIGLIKALSNFVQPSQAIFKPTDLQTGLETAVFLLGYQLKYDVYSIEVRHQQPESLLTVNGSTSELIQLFINVLLNSIEAIKSKQAESLKGVIEIGTYQDNSWGVVTISDNGSGIPSEDLERVFTPGFTTKGAAHRGMGLSIARQIVERHNGLIEITREQQKGTTVKISLPLIDVEDSQE